MARLLPPTFQTIPDFAADLRSNLGKTQQEIADLIGKPRTHISKYENDKMFPPAGYLAHLICLQVERLLDPQAIASYQEVSLREMNRALEHYTELLPLRDWGELLCLADHYISGSEAPFSLPPSLARGLSVASTEDLYSLPPCPYRGLFTFRPEDHQIFFGRKLFTQRLLQAIASRPLITVMGSSGSGKSSVIFAGLVPALLARPDEKWLYVTFRPTEDPFLGAAKTLVDLLEPNLGKTKQLTAVSDLADHLRTRRIAFTECLLQIQQIYRNQHLLIIIDQLEELFTLVRNADVRQQFGDALLAVVETIQGASPRLALTLRADFSEQVFSCRPLADALQGSIEVLGPLTRDELRAVIEKPAELHNISFEAKLVDRFLDDVGQEAGRLPLLEFALTELWPHQRQQMLTHVAYEEIGQIKGALGRYTDNIYQNLPPDKQEQARQLFIQLVSPGVSTTDTRRRATRTELTAEWPLVVELATKRLVVTNQAPVTAEPETVELVHEALIYYWECLKKWLDDARAFRIWQERLRFALGQWQDCGQGEEALLRGVLLNEAERWLIERDQEISQTEHDFIHTSVRLREQEQRQAKKHRAVRWTMLAVSLLLLALLVWLGGPQGRLWWLTQCLPECANRNLARLNLSGAKLNGANLHGADLSESLLRRADLSEAKLHQANLSQADLTGAALWDADLSGADLSGANLSGTDLHWANLITVTINDKTTIAAKWRLVWELVNQGAVGRDLSAVDLSKANLHKTDFQGADLRNADLREAKLWGANLRGANLLGANLTEANLDWVDLHFAKINNTTLIAAKWRLVWEIIQYSKDGRDLHEVDLSKVDLHQAQLSSANLQRADLREAKLWGAMLARANLHEANLAKANLRWATLTFSKLNGADLRAANLNEANLEKADLTDAIYNDDTIWPQGFDPAAAGARSSE